MKKINLTPFILILLIFTASNLAAREGYELSAAKIQRSGALCITEFMTKSYGSNFHCSDDQIKDAAAADELNKKIESYFDKKPPAMLGHFLYNRPKKENGNYQFKIEDFKKYIDQLEASPTCKSATSLYKQRSAEIDKKLAEIRRLRMSNEDSIVSACTPAKEVSASSTGQR